MGITIISPDVSNIMHLIIIKGPMSLACRSSNASLSFLTFFCTTPALLQSSVMLILISSTFAYIPGLGLSVSTLFTIQVLA